MKTGFKDPIEPREKKSAERPFSYKNPGYDQRTSHFISAGDNYGVGFNQPLGSEKIASDYAVPVGRIKTMKVYD